MHVTIVGIQGSTSLTLLPWTVNYNFASTADLDSAACATVAQTVMTSIAASSSVQAALSEFVSIASVRVAMHHVDTGPETSVGVSTHAAVGGSSAHSCPPQVSVVATLRTGTPGRSYRGRIYWPAGPFAPDQSGILSLGVGVLNTAVQDIAQFIEAAALVAGPALVWYVWSPTKGTGAPITEVSVGGRADTQRRRNSGPDTYTNFPVT